MAVTPEQQLDWIVEHLPRTQVERLPLGDSLGRTLAEDVTARHPLPLWDNSAMDGYAVRSEDVAAASADRPAPLRIVGEVLAGSGEDPPIAAGEAVRIMTGAAVPTNADAVIAVELTEGEAGPGLWAECLAQVREAALPGRNIRRLGEDVPEGAVLARSGCEITPSRLAGLTAAGVEHVSVAALPRVSVIATGTELRTIGEPLARGEIRETNAAMVAGLLAETGIESVSVHRSTDSVEALAELMGECARSADVIITTGGIGPGLHDVTRIVLEGEPGVRATRVEVRPAQLQCAGTLRSGPFVFALPGNPVSAAVSFELFVRPALLAAQGRDRIHRLLIPARVATPWVGKPGRLQVMPVSLSNEGGAVLCSPVVDPRGLSHAVGGHGDTDGYALIEAGRCDVGLGETVSVMLLGR